MRNDKNLLHTPGTAGLFALLAGVLAGCGGGGSAAATPTTDEPAAEPVLAAVSPAEVDADRGGRLVLEGAALDRDVRLIVMDDAGIQQGPSLRLDADASGSRAEADLPALAGPGAERRLTLRLRRGDGTAVDGGVTLICRREYRSIDGTGNNRRDPDLGRAGSALLRRAPEAYADGEAALARPRSPSPRVISNVVVAQPESRLNRLGASDMVWQWGQLLDHDLDLTVAADPVERADIAVPLGDPSFDPRGTGTQVIPFSRSAFEAGVLPRRQVNALTAWIDASNVYGSDEARMRALRMLDGSGRMKMSAGDLLPFNVDGLPNAGGPSPELFLAGDVRANEQVGLAAIHTLWVREHNRLALELAARHPELGEEDLFQEARRTVGALMQAITYREFLPLVLGPDALPPYRGYDPALDPGIANEFSTSAYRFGHSLLSSRLERLDEDGLEIPQGHLTLQGSFLRSHLLVTDGGIDPVLRGLCAQPCQELDAFIVDDVRNFLFGPPGAGGLDLASLNLQRGRDHGLADYDDVRAAYGLARKTAVEEISSDPEVRRRLHEAYGGVDGIDPWIGGLCEDHVPGALVGELIRAVLVDQFRRLRDGDRFWYERILHGRELDAVRRTRLSDVIRRNTSIGPELDDDALRAAPPG
jgi:hypothetical protein